MRTYKINNRVKSCIIRSITPGFLGDTEMQYANQPYTILHDIAGQLTFETNTKSNQKGAYNIFHYSHASVSELRLNDVSLTSKILNLIFPKTEAKLVQRSTILSTDEEGRIFLPHGAVWHEVFVYSNQELQTFIQLAESEINELEPNQPYLVCYGIVQDGVSLNGTSNFYVSVDLELENNIDEERSTTFIHLSKCHITTDNSIRFEKDDTTTANLIFHVIADSDEEDYMSFC